MKHYNPSISLDAARIFNSKGGDYLSPEIEDKIRAVVPITPVATLVRHTSSTTSGTVTIFSTPSDKDFYLTAYAASFIKDAACDLPTGRFTLNATVDGVAREIDAFAVITLTAQSGKINMALSIPLKVDRGTNITLTGTFTAGVMSRTASIQGYTVEVTK